MENYRYGVDDITLSVQSLSLSQNGDAASYFHEVVGNYFDFIRLSGATTDDISSCLQRISRIYRSCLRDTSSRINWGDASYRRAYICRFFAMHAYLVYWSLEKSLPTFQEFCLNKYRLHVCCLGGGPGSDVVGLAKFLRDSNNCETIVPVSLECAIFDVYPQWEIEWEIINMEDPGRYTSGVRYMGADLTAKRHCLTRTELSTVRSADIITMVKFYSTVAAFMRSDDAHGNLLRQIFREMKPGALVLYIDNQYYSQHQEFRRIARAGGVTESLFEWHGTVTMLSVSHSRSINRITQATGITPMDSCKVSVMLLRKPT